MKIRGGHRFWFNQPDMLRHAENAEIFIKYADTEFTSFDNFALFLKWFENYMKCCAATKIPFTILEILRTGIDMCFICDIEVYCPLEMTDSVFQKVAYTLRKKFREVYGKYANANNVIFMEDHRPSSTKLHKSDTQKTPMKKMSFHALGLSEIFDEMHTTCEMQKLADLVNKDLVAEMAAITERHQIFLPNKNILDMKIYTRNRGMRTVLAQKDLGSGGFQLSECSKHVSIRNCFATKVLCGTEKSYYKIPAEFRVTQEEKPINSTNHVPKRMAPRIHRTAEMTLGKMETEVDINRYLTQTFGDDVTVKYNGIYGIRDSYEVRGHRHCPLCDDEHVRNCAYVNDVGGGNFSYNCRASTDRKRPYNIDMSKFKGVEGATDSRQGCNIDTCKAGGGTGSPSIPRIICSHNKEGYLNMWADGVRQDLPDKGVYPTVSKRHTDPIRNLQERHDRLSQRHVRRVSCIHRRDKPGPADPGVRVPPSTH